MTLRWESNSSNRSTQIEAELTKDWTLLPMLFFEPHSSDRKQMSGASTTYNTSTESLQPLWLSLSL